MKLTVLLFLAAVAPVSARVPEPSECVIPGDIGRSLECYTAIISSLDESAPPAHRSEMHYYRALLFMNLSRPEKAAADYTQAIMALGGPGGRKSARLICERAGAYRSMGETAKALADYAACSRSGKSWAEMAIGEILVGRGELEAGLKAMNRAVERGEKYGYSYQTRAGAYLLAGRYAEAAEDAEKAAALSPSDTDILFLRARTRLNSGDPEGALRDLDRLEKLGGADGELLACRGMAHYLLGDGDAARTAFEKAATARDLSLEASLNMACYWLKIRKDPVKARELLDAARAKGSRSLPPAAGSCLGDFR